MKTIFKTAVALSVMSVVLASCSDSDNQSSTPQPEKEIQLSRAESESMGEITKFSLNLLWQSAKCFETDSLGNLTITGESHDNITIPPLSVAVSLAMMANATDKETCDEITRLFEIEDGDITTMNEMFKKLLTQLPMLDKVSKLTLANSIWADYTYSFPETFVDRMKSDYNAEIMSVAAGNVDKHQLNQWITAQTGGENDRTSDEYGSNRYGYFMSAFNAVYFEGEWSKPFETQLTKSANFSNYDATVARVEMMEQTIKTIYHQTDDYKAVRLPFGNRSFSLSLFLPAESKSPVQLLEALVNGGWSEFNTLTVEKQPSNGIMTTLRLPRFETTCDVDLEHALTACGITRLREAKIPAEFRSDNTELEASIVIGQWAKIKIDEDGVKASATAQSAHIPEGASRPTEVTFNRPFVYILSERSTGAILIGGIINKL